MDIRRLAILVFALAAALSSPGQATVRLTVDATEAYEAEAVNVEVTIYNFTEASDFEFPEIPGCRITPLGAPQNIRSESWINGVRSVSNSRTYGYELIAAAPGEYVIPEIEITVDGQTLRTAPARLRVVPGAVADLVQAEISGGGSRLYVGQRAVFTLTIWLRPVRSFGLAEMLESIKQARGGRYGPFQRVTRSGVTDRPDASGKPQKFYYYELDAEFVLARPGPPLDDVLVAVNYPTRFGRGIFGDEVTKVRQLRVAPRILAPDVLPLPTDGRPAGFSGAVGEYTLDVSASRTNVRVGDPIELTIAIGGNGPLDTLPGPDLSRQRKLLQHFRVPGEALAGRTIGNRRVFTQTIRPTGVDATAIPPIEFPYFDPRRGEFAVALSEPIALTVTAAPTLDVESLPAAPTPGGENTTVLNPIDGLLGNESSVDRLLEKSSPVTMGQVWAAVLAPPALYVALAGFAAWRSRRDASVERRRTALSTALRRLDGAKPTEIVAAVAGYFGDRLNQPAARFEGRAAVELLADRNASAETVSRLRELLARCDEAAYAGGAGDGSLAELARECLRRLESERLG